MTALKARRFRLTLEYEGTRYSGWQIQKNARTVQGEIAKAIHTVFQTADFELYGSGRTDAGVHALMQVAHLQLKTMLAPEIIRLKLNDLLPSDINILEVEKVPPTFHARHSAVERSYLYQISRRRSAFGKRFVWWVEDPLDVPLMEKAAQLFIGLKEMSSFTAENDEEKSTKILINNIELKETGDLILIRITGSHFLWKLVRRVVGILVEIGRGSLTINRLEHLLRQTSAEPAKYTAPPSGLFLERVEYEKEKSAKDLQPVLLISSPDARPSRSRSAPHR